MNSTDRLNHVVQVVFGGEVAAFAAALGKQPASLYKYMKGQREVGKKMLAELEATIGIDAVWLQVGVGDMFADNDAGRELRNKVTGNQYFGVQSLSDYLAGAKPAMIPIYYPPVDAGRPMIVADDPFTWEGVADKILRKPETKFAVYARGNSMLYDGIRDGDILIVDRGVTPQSGDIVIAYYDGGVCVKRLEIKDGETWLMPSNDEFEPVQVMPDQYLKIWGVVKNLIHSF